MKFDPPPPPISLFVAYMTTRYIFFVHFKMTSKVV